MYKTKLGIRLMDKIAKKFPRLLIVLGYFGIFVGFVGMALTFGFIIWAAYRLIFVPSAEAVLAPVLPGITISEQLPVLSFWHWIIAILVVAIVHEFSHGVYSRLRDIKIKSSGFAFLGPILAAFVEPDEKQLKKKRISDQLLVFSAGPFSNIILGVFLFLLLVFVFVPITANMVQVNGIIVAGVNSSLPVGTSGLVAGHVIEEVDGKRIDNINTLDEVLKGKKPSDVLNVKANGTYYNIVLAGHPEDNNKAFIGMSFSKYDTELKNNSLSWLHKFLSWFNMLLFWTFNISIGVGLFNLLPLGPVDGGRMFHVAMVSFTKNEKKALKLLGFMSFIVLLLIILNLFPFFIKLFRFLFGFLL